MVVIIVLTVVVVVMVVVVHAAVFVFAATVKQLHKNMVLFAADANYQQTQMPAAF
jgi:hypothetical protein